MITWKPTGFYSRVSTRDCLKFRELKYEVVTASKVVGEHSYPNLRGWEGSLTGKGNKCQMTLITLGSEDVPSNSNPY